MIEIRPKYHPGDLRDWRVFVDGVAVADSGTLRRRRSVWLLDGSAAVYAPEATARKMAAEPARVLGLLGLLGVDVDGPVTVNPEPPARLT